MVYCMPNNMFFAPFYICYIFRYGFYIEPVVMCKSPLYTNKNKVTHKNIYGF